jgi:hypothetical protein
MFLILIFGFIEEFAHVEKYGLIFPPGKKQARTKANMGVHVSIFRVCLLCSCSPTHWPWKMVDLLFGLRGSLPVEGKSGLIHPQARNTAHTRRKMRGVKVYYMVHVVFLPSSSPGCSYNSSMAKELCVCLFEEFALVEKEKLV